MNGGLGKRCGLWLGAGAAPPLVVLCWKSWQCREPSTEQKLRAFTSAVSELLGPFTIHTEEMSILDGSWRGEEGCIWVKNKRMPICGTFFEVVACVLQLCDRFVRAFFMISLISSSSVRNRAEITSALEAVWRRTMPS